MAKLTVDNVTYRYRNSESAAVKNASCSFDEGHVYAIIGPSGSGKSTLLSMLAGLDAPTEGQVLFDGTPLSEMDIDVYRQRDISMIFQAFQLFPLLTVIENVCYPSELMGVEPENAKMRAAQCLERVGIIEEKYKRFPANLSGGEQQRVAIARSLASGAKLILADEPTGNLDVANTGIVMDILSDLSSSDGYCVIIVTHDMEVAEKADVVYRIKDGELTRI